MKEKYNDKIIFQHGIREIKIRANEIGLKNSYRGILK